MGRSAPMFDDKLLYERRCLDGDEGFQLVVREFDQAIGVLLYHHI